MLCSDRKIWHNVTGHISYKWDNDEDTAPQGALGQRYDKGKVMRRCRNSSPYFPDIESVNLDSDEWSSDINNVSSVLKLWLRELPDPLLTSTLHQGFIDAAST